MHIAHKREEIRLQPLAEHLENVGELCGQFAGVFGAESLGRLIGLCHDIGKYSQGFYKRIMENGPKVDHSTAGGIELAAVCRDLFAYCVCGHHGGLPDGGSVNLPGTLRERLSRSFDTADKDYSAYRTEIKLFNPDQSACSPLGEAGFSASMLVRMLFSCLVDADFLDTERFMSNNTVQRGGYQDIPTLCDKLDSRLYKFFKPSKPINRKRTEILLNCIDAAEGDRGLYSLTVPTGGGKTLSSLAFALHHAKKHGMTRVIYVIPFVSIIDQTASQFVKLLGRENVLEHHSNVDYNNRDGSEKTEPDETVQKHYLAAENWDVPVVVTTNVQFFESLFAAKPSKCRKLHNIANSVIIFDEAQMLPLPFLRPCTRAIAELVHNYGCTAVLCSATQPTLDKYFPPEVPCREICSDPAGLYSFFRRVTLKNLGKLTDVELAERLTGHDRALCIVNTLEQAQTIFKMLPEEGSYHLSSLMYPEHRRSVLKEIRTRLADGLSCRVISTSLVEAGVDLDFPVVYRARAGLDSIVQAAGRCNREGNNPADESFVYIFEPDSVYRLPPTMSQPAAVFSLIADKHGDDLDSPEAISAFFNYLYNVRGEALDVNRIVQRFENGAEYNNYPFQAVAKKFKLIGYDTKAVLIPIAEKAKEYSRRLRAGERSRQLLREAGMYSVNVRDGYYRELRELGIIDELDSELAILSDVGRYNASTGLTLPPE